MISAHDIHKLEDKKRTIRKEIYKKIYEQFCKKIKLSVEMGLKSVTMIIPTFVLGYPTFDQQKASIYIRRQFENAGFKIVNKSPIEFDVSWKRTKNKTTSSHSQSHEPEENLPSLINLKKLAAKHKGA